MDRGHAPYAALGTSRPVAHAGVAMVFGSDCHPSIGGSGAGLSRHLPYAAICHDLDGRYLGVEANFALEEIRTDSCLGCLGFSYLDDEFCAQEHPLAGWRILHP